MNAATIILTALLCSSAACISSERMQRLETGLGSVETFVDIVREDVAEIRENSEDADGSLAQLGGVLDELSTAVTSVKEDAAAAADQLAEDELAMSEGRLPSTGSGLADLAIAVLGTVVLGTKVTNTVRDKRRVSRGEKIHPDQPGAANAS